MEDHFTRLEQTINRDYGNISGILVQKGGRTVYENYFHDYAAEDAFHVYSVTKSVISALIGIAIDQGYLTDVDQYVLDFFPESRSTIHDAAARSITIRHLLTMTATYRYETEPFEDFFASSNWVAFALSLLGGRMPTGEFLYAAIAGTHILSGILATATGQTVLDFASKNLFLPLGIPVTHSTVFQSKEEQLAWYEKDRHTRGWVADPQGVNTASWGLTLTAADMAKIGRLYLSEGMWNGKQIIPARWIAESTREHSRWGALSYGYLWWRIGQESHSYAALGDGGNAICVDPQNDLVVSITALSMPEARDSVTLIEEQITPIFQAGP